jgi:hypothetical protein
VLGKYPSVFLCCKFSIIRPSDWSANFLDDFFKRAQVPSSAGSNNGNIKILPAALRRTAIPHTMPSKRPNSVTLWRRWTQRPESNPTCIQEPGKPPISHAVQLPCAIIVYVSPSNGPFTKPLPLVSFHFPMIQLSLSDAKFAYTTVSKYLPAE